MSKTPLLTLELFADKVGESFALHFDAQYGTFQTGDQSLSQGGDPLGTLVLEEATPLPEPTGFTLTRPPFSLVFRGPSGPFFEQQTYRLVHRKLGEVSLFLVPIGYAPDGSCRYQALFN